MRWRRFASLVRKELIQFLRARAMLALILYLFTGEVFQCTDAMRFDVRDLPTAIVDSDRSATSRALARALSSSGYFRLVYAATRNDELAADLNSGAVVAAVIVPEGFERDVTQGKPATLQLLLDGTNANTASVAHGYAQRIVHNFAMSRVQGAMVLPVSHVPRVWYNSELEYSYFMVLSMIALAGTMVGIITAAASAVREKESGTLEQLLVTPATTFELIAAKSVPPLLVTLIALFPSLLIAEAVGVPLRGSLPLFILFSVIFMLSNLGLGFLVATMSDTLQQALLISFLIMFPMLFLSGTIVPLESMPKALQYAAQLSPLRHYMEVVLSLFLKGVGLDILWPRLLALLGLGTVLLGLGVARFRRQLT